MKKIYVILLSVILVFCIAGCNKNSEDLSKNKNEIQHVENDNVSDEIIVDTEIEINETDKIFVEEYIFKDSDKKQVRYDYELFNYSKDELELGKNEIFARYGYDFDSENLEKYFLSKSWYEKIEGKKITFDELNTYEQENVKDIDEYIKLLKEVENCKDINTVVVPDLVIDDTLIDAEILIDTDEIEYVELWTDESNKYVKLSEDYVLDEKWDESLHHKYFENQKELLPKKIYLMNENVNCYYEYNGEMYYIPIEKCEKPEEERIEYRDHSLVVYRNSNLAKIWNLETKLYDDREDFCCMESLYINDLKYKQIDRVYEIDLDGDINTVEISIPCYYFDPGDGIELTSFVAMKNGDEASIASGVDYFLCGNIGNYRNVFYSKGFSRGWPINMSINECFLVKYYIYDKEEGFITVNRLANGDKWNENLEKMNSYELTLSEEHTFYKSEGEIEGEKFEYKGYFVDEKEPEKIILPEGTKIRLIKLLDWATNSIIETEDGTRYYIGSLAGMT